jgi:hypothetical protein
MDRSNGLSSQFMGILGDIITRVDSIAHERNELASESQEAATKLTGEFGRSAWAGRMARRQP